MHTAVLDPRAQLNSVYVFRVSVVTLEDLCLHLRHLPQIRHRFSTPGSDVVIGLASDEEPPFRFAAWGVQRTFEAAHQNNYATIQSTMEWRGRAVGMIALSRRPNSLTRNSEEAVGNITLKADDSAPSSAIVPAGLEERHEIELVPSYMGIALPMYDVMLTILKVMVMSVEKGPETFCDQIVMPKFSLRPESAVGRQVLTWKQVAKMMRILAMWMVAQERYQEVGFLIKRDGIIIAIGSLRRR